MDGIRWKGPSRNRANGRLLAGLLVLAAAGSVHAKEWTLDALIDSGLSRNPALLAERQQASTAALDTLPSATAVNPHLEAEAMHNLTEPDRPTAGLRLSKEFRPGYRSRFRHAARDAWSAREAWVKAEELELIRDIRSAWIDWQILDRKLGMQREVRERWEGLSRLATEQVAQGRMSELDQAEARLNAVKARQRELALLSGRQAAGRRLQVLAGLGEAPELGKAMGLDSLPALPGLDTLLSQARKESPVIVALAREETASRSRVELEQGPAIPEFSLSLGYERETEGEHLVGGGIELPLPLFNRNQAGIAKAKSGLKEAQLRKSAAEERLRAEVSGAHARLASLAERYGHYRDQVRELIRKQLRLSESGFRQGLLGVFELSRVQAEYLAQEEEALGLLEEYYSEWNRLGQAVGGRIW
jgi:cobalt-zinc-cadmium efflux system outer membrane protein